MALVAGASVIRCLPLADVLTATAIAAAMVFAELTLIAWRHRATAGRPPPRSCWVRPGPGDRHPDRQQLATAKLRVGPAQGGWSFLTLHEAYSASPDERAG